MLRILARMGAAFNIISYNRFDLSNVDPGLLRPPPGQRRARIGPILPTDEGLSMLFSRSDLLELSNIRIKTILTFY